MRRYETAVYPHRDRYLDRTPVDVETNEWVRLTIEYVDSAGKVAETIRREGTIDERFWLDARTAGGTMWPAGRYLLRATAVDRDGNVRETERRFTVSHKRLVKRTWRRTFSAADVLTQGGIDVGDCSTLKRPARSDWRESRGYYSMTKCDNADEGQVASVNGVWVPKALEGRYDWLQISMHGAGARSGGLRNGPDAYLNFGYYNKAGTFTGRAEFDGRMIEHFGPRVKANGFVRDKDSAPYILFWTGLAGGSRYDVKSFTVRLRRSVLR
ncbi:hypothetical protein [Nocardioides speluncae]|uniref:hypothetical protein n=1 Tax=Nocardioides speluncae TaxID=2670337 RepID=UPI000D68A714|nr:hypothetical protein [Nocardioides speluncae]